MVVRTYFKESNTIIKDSLLNTGKNPIAELYYGTDGNGNQVYSRYLFQLDLSELQILHDKNALGSNPKHFIRMTNTGIFENDLANAITGDGKVRTSGFHLDLFELDRPFTSGKGYDYVNSPQAITSAYPSNWKYSTHGIEWAESGAVLNNEVATPVDSMFFSDGTENLEMDVTALVNQYLSGVKTHHGFCLVFRHDIEALRTEDLQYVGFFTPNTQTFFEPFMESKPEYAIKDDRYNFILGKENSLYLYVHKNGEPTNLDVLPTVTVEGYTGGALTVSNERTGTYRTTLTLTKDEANGITSNILLSDTWSNLILDGNTLEDVVMDFHVKSPESYFKAGNEDVRPTKYKINIGGLRMDESLNRGEVRKVYVNAVEEYSTSKIVALDKIEYQIYVKEGQNKHIVVDYTQLDNSGINNYFLLHTSSLLPSKYYIDIKYTSNLDIRIDNEALSFTVK